MRHRRRSAAARAAAAVAIALGQGAAQAGGVTGADLEEVTVRANRLALGGAPRAASEGTVLGEQLENRPLLRVGELLETVHAVTYGLLVEHRADDQLLDVGTAAQGRE